MADGSVSPARVGDSANAQQPTCCCDRESLYQQMSVAMATLWDLQGVLSLLREAAMQNTEIPESITATIRMASARVDSVVEKIDF